MPPLLAIIRTHVYPRARRVDKAWRGSSQVAHLILGTGGILAAVVIAAKGIMLLGAQ